MPKAHSLRSYKVGLFENDVTHCGVVGNAKDGTLIQHRTGARFKLSDSPTCKWCIQNA